MRKIIGLLAELGVVGLLAAPGATWTTSSLAVEEFDFGACTFQFDDFHVTISCPGSRVTDSKSTGLFPDRCNGELGFWYAVTFANGETLCIPRSTADFYGGSNSVPTCTSTQWGEEGPGPSTTSDGTCPPGFSFSQSY